MPSDDLRFDPRFRCSALSKRSGERCRRRAHPGATVCTLHGAKAPQVQRSARARLEQQRMAKQLGKVMVELEQEAIRDHPIDVLHDAVARAEALVRVIAGQVAKLDGETGGDWSKPAALYGPNHLGDGTPHVLVKMYTEALERSGKLSEAAIRVGLDERRVILQEQQAHLLWAALRASVLEVMLRFERMLSIDRRAEFRMFVGNAEGEDGSMVGLAEVLLRHIARFENDPAALAQEGSMTGLGLGSSRAVLDLPLAERMEWEQEVSGADGD